MRLNKGTVYSFEEGLKIMGMSRAERIHYELSKELEKENIHFKKDDMVFNTLALSLGCIMYGEKVLAAGPKTGVPKLDTGGWKLVGVAQSVIFWAAMIYTFKSLLELALKGEGTWKKVGTGFLICAMDYLIPWGFELIRSIFI